MNRTFWLEGALVSTLAGCGFIGDAERLEAPPKLTKRLEDVLRHCDDGSGVDACKRAMNTPSWIAGKNRKVPSGFLSLSVVESCQTQNFAELEAVVLLTSGVTRIRAGFLRRIDGEWFSGRIVTVEESTPKLCEDIPLMYGLEAAKEGLEDAQGWVVWSRADGRDAFDFRPLWRYQCELKTVILGRSPDEDPDRVDVGCWLSDGFPTLSDESSPVYVESDEIPYVYVQVVFTDDTHTDIVKIENPNWKGR
ncbi:MAG: hypothetical protein ACRBN8_45790 [Nannocystales bacterium]